MHNKFWVWYFFFGWRLPGTNSQGLKLSKSQSPAAKKLRECTRTGCCSKAVLFKGSYFKSLLPAMTPKARSPHDKPLTPNLIIIFHNIHMNHMINSPYISSLLRLSIISWFVHNFEESLKRLRNAIVGDDENFGALPHLSFLQQTLKYNC